MRLNVILLILTSLPSLAISYSQDSRVSINMKDGNIVDIFNEIENQSEYRIFYRADEIDLEKKYTVDYHNEQIGYMLSDLLKGSKFTYELVDKIIVITSYKQQPKVTGTVTDGTTGEPLAGVYVRIKNTNTGSVTDNEGKYSVDTPSPDAILQFSYIGYISEEISVSGKTQIDVQLVPDIQSLEEVIVIGYGAQKKSDITGAISQVKTTDMQNRTSANIGQALQGKSAGTQIVFSSGAPGSTTSIRIRGYSSNSSSEPLYIVDGLKVTSIDYLDAENIESVEILKDAASAAIYGAEAGNGVVLITTKKGSKDAEGTLFYNMQYTVSSLARNPEVMNASQYADFMVQAGVFSQDNLDAYWDGNTNTNWSDVVFTNGITKRHTFGFQGGNDRGSLYVSFSSLNNNGIVTGNKDVYTRLTSQINADYKIKKWLTVGLTSAFEQGKTKSVSENSEFGSTISNVYIMDPLTPDYYTWGNLPGYVQNLYDAGYNLLTNNDGNLYGISQFSMLTHPLETRDITDAATKRMNAIGTFYANFTPIKNLVITSRFGYRFGYSDFSEYTQPYYVNSSSTQENGSLEGKTITNLFYQWDNFANYSYDIGKHTISAMAGMSYQKSDSSYIDVTTDLLTSEARNFRYLSNSSTSANDVVTGYPTDQASISYFGRIGWSYDNRYNLQANFRADAFDASKLSKSARWGYFPSVSAGWTLSNEAFMQNISKDIISHLKLRGSWGINGNVNVLNNYVYSTSLSTSSSGYDYYSSGGTTNAVTPSAVLANPELKWETSKQIDVGVDARFLRDRLTFTMDFYSKNTDGLLTESTPALITGASTTYVNAGKVHNHGFEFELGWREKRGDFNYSFNGNLATLYNNVTEGPSTTRLTGEAIQGLGEGTTYFEEDYPVWYIRGYQFDHIDASTGQAFFKTIDGSTTATPTEDDRTYIGDGIPDFTYGLTINLEYKGLDLTLFGSGSVGSDMMMAFTRGDKKSVNRMAFFETEAWNPNNTNAGRPSPYYQITQMSYYLTSDAMVYKGSYFKVKQIQIGYTVPQNIIQKIKMSNLRAYVSFDDFFTFTNYPGFDPETRSGTTSGMALDKISYPVSKKVVFGVNVSF